MILGIFEGILILLVVAVLVTMIFRRLSLPTIVGYILVGICVGPHVLAWINNTQDTRDLAEFGVVFLIFTIGLEFSLPRLMSMRKVVFIYGSLQVILSILITSLIAMFLPMTKSEAILVGSIVAMSSTAIVMKQLNEQFELHTVHGMNAVGILLFQDLAVIPLLILVPSLVISANYNVTQYLLWALVKGVIAISVILIVGRWVLRPTFYQIAKRRSVELFTLMALLVTLGTAWITQQLGLSLALGAFLAGIMLGETEFRHQLEDVVRPFRDVLLALFFISIGMQFNPLTVLHAWPWILLLLTALIIGKLILIMIINMSFGNSPVTSFRTGLVLAQGGEFGFALLLSALNYEIIRDSYAQVVLGAILISMLLSPFMILFNRSITNFVFRRKIRHKEDEAEDELPLLASKPTKHVIICGYGRVGQNIAHLLEDFDIQYVAFDLNAKRVQEAKLAGDTVFYADASNYQILQAANINQSRALIISFYSAKETEKILQQVRQHNNRIAVIVRSQYEDETAHFYQLGATEVIPETLETSLVFVSHIMLLLRMPIDKVKRMMNHIRHDRYDILNHIFPGEEGLNFNETEIPQQGLHSMILPTKAYAVGKKIGDLALTEFEVKITRLRRNNHHIKNPSEDYVLLAGDVIVLFGKIEHIELAETRIIKG